MRLNWTLATNATVLVGIVIYSGCNVDVKTTATATAATTAASSRQEKAEMKLSYPETRRVEQVDEFHGVKVADPYRWLEADVRESPEVAEWVKQQNEVARAYLDAIPQRPAIERRLTELFELRAILAADGRKAASIST